MTKASNDGIAPESPLADGQRDAEGDVSKDDAASDAKGVAET